MERHVKLLAFDIIWLKITLTHSSFWNILIFDIETSIFSFLCNVLSFCLFSIPLSGLLRFKVSDYPFGIFKFFLQWWTYNAWSQDISSDLWRHEASVGLWHTYVIYRTCHNHHIEIFVGIINNVFFLLNRTIKMFYHSKLHKQLKVLIDNRCSGW